MDFYATPEIWITHEKLYGVCETYGRFVNLFCETYASFLSWFVKSI